MPKVEIGRARTGLQPRGANIRANTGIARSLQSIGGALTEMGLEQKRKEELARDQNYITNAIIDAAKIKVDLDEEFAPTLEEPEGYQERYIETYQLRLQGLLDNAPSEESRAKLQSQLTPQIVNTIFQASKDERVATVNKYRAERQRTTNLLTNNLLLNPTEENLQLAIQGISSHSEASGTYDDVDSIRKYESSALKDVHETYIRGLAQRDMGAAMERLSQDDMKMLYDEDEFEKLVGRIESAGEEHEKALEESEKLRQERTLFELDQRVASGEVFSPEEVDTLVDFGYLTPRQGRTALDITQTDRQRDDIKVLTKWNKLYSLGQLTPEIVLEDAGSVTNATIKTYLNRSQLNPDESFRIKRAMDILEAQYPRNAFGGFDKQEDAIRLNDAQEEFFQRTIDAEKPEEPLRVARDIVQRSQEEILLDEKSAVKRNMIRDLGGAKNINDISYRSIQEKEKSIAEKFMKGQITEDFAREQAEALDDIKKSIGIK